MKQSKFNHNRIKPKYKHEKKQKITQEERDYLQWLQLETFSCVVCGTANMIEMHHVKEHSIDKKDHKRLIPLCVEHHRLSNELSAHGTPRKFKELYPVEFQNELADKIYLLYKSQQG